MIKKSEFCGISSLNIAIFLLKNVNFVVSHRYFCFLHTKSKGKKVKNDHFFTHDLRIKIYFS